MDVCLKKKKFLAQRGVIVNDDRKLRARQKRANEFSSVSLAREILNATTDLKLSSETLTDYPTHAVLQGCRSVQEQDRRQGVFFFPSGESRYPLSLLFVSVFFFVEGGWCRGGERRGERVQINFCSAYEKKLFYFLFSSSSSSSYCCRRIDRVCVLRNNPVPVYSTKHVVAHIYFRFFPSHRRLSATLSKPRAKPARLPSMALVVSAVTF